MPWMRGAEGIVPRASYFLPMKQLSEGFFGRGCSENVFPLYSDLVLAPAERALRLFPSQSHFQRSKHQSRLRRTGVASQGGTEIMPKLYVGNLPRSITESALEEFLQNAECPVESIKLVRDFDTGLPRGFAFVELNVDADLEGTIQKLNWSLTSFQIKSL